MAGVRDGQPPGPGGVRDGQPPGPGGVQSVRRAFGLLETLAGTARWACRNWPRSSTRSVLRLIHLGEWSSRLPTTWAVPHLARFDYQLGETANLAMLDGDEIVYVAQAPSRHSMRMFIEVGRHVLTIACICSGGSSASSPPDRGAVRH